MIESPRLFALFLGCLTLLAVFFASIHNISTPSRANQALYLPCGNATPLRYGDPLDYDDVFEAEHELCNTNYFPYCHTLSLVFYNAVPDDLLANNWLEYTCARDLIPDAACVERMPPAEWSRGPYTYSENDTGCLEP